MMGTWGELWNLGSVLKTEVLHEQNCLDALPLGLNSKVSSCPAGIASDQYLNTSMLTLYSRNKDTVGFSLTWFLV